jgi:hypothetical protein
VSEKVKLLALTREAFNRILGNIKAYLKEDSKKEGALDDSFVSHGSAQERWQAGKNE